MALNSCLLCLWGPPGTGKTETIVEMIYALQTADPKARVLVTVPTHNVVDNMMRRYIPRLQKQPFARKTQPDLVRVSTENRLRPTVNQTALALDFDISLFERLYTKVKHSKGNGGLRALMLDTQYRMHPKLCEFSSGQFYEERLESGISSSARSPIRSNFSFPPARVTKQRRDPGTVDYERAIFINCDAKEMPGQKSKENRGQSEVCLHICKL
ncbi:hypothetical protein NW764_014605 [Fusarium oxysporum]|nr:hypothetical protein NW764_014605 [Fusarium oxysporum]